MRRPMSSTRERRLLLLECSLLLVVLVSAAWSGLAAAAGPQAATPFAPAPKTLAVATMQDDGAPVASPRRAAAFTDPAIASMHAEIEASLARERQSVEALQARFAQTTDPQAALAVQREVEQVKKETQLDVLRIQLRHAQETEATEAAAALQIAVDRFAVPPAPTSAQAKRDLPPAKTQPLPGAATARP